MPSIPSMLAAANGVAHLSPLLFANIATPAGSGAGASVTVPVSFPKLPSSQQSISGSQYCAFAEPGLLCEHHEQDQYRL
jgi:hypothetical protein